MRRLQTVGESSGMAGFSGAATATLGFQTPTSKSYARAG